MLFTTHRCRIFKKPGSPCGYFLRSCRHAGCHGHSWYLRGKSFSQGLRDSWTFRLCLSDEDYKDRVHIDVYLFTESSFSRRTFFDWATPGKLCSIICVIVDCLLHQFLGSIQKWVRIPYQIHLINKLKVRWSTCVVACWLSHLLGAGWTIFVKRCHNIS